MEKKVCIVLEKTAKLSGCRDDKKVNVRISDICSVNSSDKQLQDKIGHMSVCVLDVEGKKHARKLVALTELMDIIQMTMPDCDITPVGESQVLVDYNASEQKNTVKWMLVAFMCIFSFVGSMYVIMAYNNDVGTVEIFERVYELLGISEYSDKNIIEIAYGIGLALGIILFYNHFGKLRISDTPTPIQVEMDKYEKDEEDSLISQMSAVDKK